jgi:hypothetical protein
VPFLAMDENGNPKEVLRKSKGKVPKNKVKGGEVMSGPAMTMVPTAL